MVVISSPRRRNCIDLFVFMLYLVLENRFVSPVMHWAMNR